MEPLNLTPEQIKELEYKATAPLREVLRYDNYLIHYNPISQDYLLMTIYHSWHGALGKSKHLSEVIDILNSQIK